MNNNKPIKLFCCFMLAVCLTLISSCMPDEEESVAYDCQQFDGIDVSRHQGNIDWEKVATDSLIRFVYIKATEGSTYQDPKYERNIEHAQRNGLKCGSYHYFTMKSKSKDQFENFNNTTKDYTQDLIPVIDVETDDHDKDGWIINGCHIGKNMPVERGWVVLTLTKLLNYFEEAYGCKPIIYCNYPSYVQLIASDFADYPVFFGRYANSPGIEGHLIWQFTEKGHVNGIKGCVDMSRFNEGVTLDDILLDPK